MFPYLDLVNFKRRRFVPESYVDAIEEQTPGYVDQAIADWTSRINGRLRKRYGRSSQGNSLPWGQQPPTLIPQGTAPPSVTLTGIPVLGCMKVGIQITTPGALGVAVFTWTSDGGLTSTTAVTTAASVTLGSTGLKALFPAGTYSVDNQYKAEPPIPGVILRWLAELVAFDLLDARGVDPQDPAMQRAEKRRDLALSDIKEAADGEKGLFDLPVNDDVDTAVTTGAPLGYSEQSPWVWTTQQAMQGGQQDQFGSGS